MTGYNNKTQNDSELFEFFKYLDRIPPKNKSDMDWSVTIDFRVFSEFLINDIRDMQDRLENADNQYLYHVCRHIFNIIDWMTLIVVDAGFPTFISAFEHLFEKQFGDKHILQNMYNVCFEKWISQKNGQQKIGENFYNILEGKLYYRDRFDQWFEVDKTTAFDLKPNKKPIENKDAIDQLNREYKETWYDAILRQWEDKQYQGMLPDDFLQFEDEETSPEAYFDLTAAHIKTLLKNPVSIAELERWNGGKIAALEDIIKISALVSDITTKRRKDNSHTIYLLRDCLMFYEAHKTIDILNSENTSVDQILIGRKLLSNKSREWGYYIATLDALYTAHLRYPANFEEFYTEYARLLDAFVSLNSGFAATMANLADYIKNHIQTSKNKIVIFDIGFQGSIALLTKYIIDRHIIPSNQDGKIEADINVGVGAVWSKELFGDRHEGDYFPFLNRVQSATRSDELYHYKPESLNSGKIRVLMGKKEKQREAAIELVVLVMVILLAHTRK
jgi:hypothetical protein